MMLKVINSVHIMIGTVFHPEHTGLGGAKYNNSALNDIALSDQMFFEKWIDGLTRYEVIVSFDDVEYEQLNRIPILVGGNIGNTPFLYMYIADHS